MSYKGIGQMARDTDLQLRIVACVASEGLFKPELWTATYIWNIVAQPGWAAAYDYAVLTAKPVDDPEYIAPGANEAVISDAMILSAVQGVITAVVEAGQTIGTEESAVAASPAIKIDGSDPTAGQAIVDPAPPVTEPAPEPTVEG